MAENWIKPVKRKGRGCVLAGNRRNPGRMGKMPGHLAENWIKLVKRQGRGRVPAGNWIKSVERQGRCSVVAGNWIKPVKRRGRGCVPAGNRRNPGRMGEMLGHLAENGIKSVERRGRCSVLADNAPILSGRKFARFCPAAGQNRGIAGEMLQSDGMPPAVCILFCFELYLPRL